MRTKTDLSETLRDVLSDCLMGVNIPGTCDGTGNVVDAISEIPRSLSEIARAITPDAVPGHDETGGTVASLTEAVMGVTAGLCRIAEALESVAEAIRDHD
jgi:hypothetical protein